MGCEEDCINISLVLSLLIVVSLSLSAVARSDIVLVPTVETAVLLGKRLYQTSTEISGSLAFTNNVKGLHSFKIRAYFGRYKLMAQNYLFITISFCNMVRQNVSCDMGLNKPKDNIITV